MWEYWLSQDNADLHFFDLNDPNNGLTLNVKSVLMIFK
jgi:hypothetical protein